MTLFIVIINSTTSFAVGCCYFLERHTALTHFEYKNFTTYTQEFTNF